MKKIVFLCLFMFPFSVLAQRGNSEMSSAVAGESLRKRTHAMSWSYGSTFESLKNIDTDEKVEASSGEISIGYLYNFGHFELGAKFNTEMSETEGENNQRTLGSLSLVGEYNFIENRPGNDLIPYLGLNLTSSTLAEEGSSDISGRFLGLGLGLKWFPLSEIFALKAQLYFASGTLERGNLASDIDVSGAALSVGWSLYF